MKFWEGAILVVGGIWLIGRLSRRLPTHPTNAIGSVSSSDSSISNMNSAGPTVGTNTDGSSSLVGGETLQAAPPLPNQTPWSPPQTTPVISVDTSCTTCGGVSAVPPMLQPRPIVGGQVGTLDIPSNSPATTKFNSTNRYRLPARVARA